MQMPRILMISTHGYVAAEPQLGRPDTGGQVVYVLELSKALAASGFHVEILTRGFEDQPEREAACRGVEIIRLNYGGKGFIPKERLAEFVPELLTEFFRRSDSDRSGYDMIISHYWDGGVAGTALARRLNIPHVHVPHSLGLLKRQNRAWGVVGESHDDCLDHRIKNERAIYHQADLVITTSGEQTTCLCEADEYNLPASSVEQIPAGVDGSVFHTLSERGRRVLKQRLGWMGVSILCAGRLDVSKGYDLALQAFPAVLQRIPQAQLLLTVCGRHPSRREHDLLNQLKQLSRDLNVAASVRFLECVTQDRLADYYRAADVFVLPSRNEPFGMAAIEAMSCGTPTVMTTRGGLWEEMTWGQDCIYCDPMDCDALSQSICSPLVHRRIRDQLSEGGTATAALRYSWSRIAERILRAAIARKISGRRMKSTTTLS